VSKNNFNNQLMYLFQCVTIKWVIVLDGFLFVFSHGCLVCNLDSLLFYLTHNTSFWNESFNAIESDLHCESEKSEPKCFCDIFYKTQQILIKISR